MNKRLIVISGISILLISGASAVAINLNKSTETPTMTQPVKHQKANTKEDPTTVTFAVDQTTPPAPVDATAPPAVVVTPNPTVTPPATPTPVTYKWASDMAQSGIAEADYGFATKLLLDDNGWRTKVGANGERLWQKANFFTVSPSDPTGLIMHLSYAKRWVDQFYAGSWSAAYDLYVKLGNF